MKRGRQIRPLVAAKPDHVVPVVDGIRMFIQEKEHSVRTGKVTSAEELAEVAIVFVQEFTRIPDHAVQRIAAKPLSVVGADLIGWTLESPDRLADRVSQQSFG